MVKAKKDVLNAGEVGMLYREKVIDKAEALKVLNNRKFNAGELLYLMKEGIFSLAEVREKLGFGGDV